MTARAFWPSEPDLKEGAGAGLSWVLVLLVVVGLALAASLVGGRFRFRWSWTDGLVVAVMILVAVSATHAVDRRPAINLAWEWAALGLAYLLLRNLPRTRDESSVLAGAIVATAVAVSVVWSVSGQGRAAAHPGGISAQSRGRCSQKMGIEPGGRGEVMLKNRLMARTSRGRPSRWPIRWRASSSGRSCWRWPSGF